MATVPSAPVALVLGAKVYPDGTPSPFLAARLDLAKQLYDAGKVRVVLVSGDNGAPEYNEPDAMRAYLIRAGMPAEDVVADYAGFDTYDSCSRARRIFGVRQAIVVTQTFHLERAVALCRTQGVDATGVGDDSVRKTDAWPRNAFRDQLACVKTVIDLVSGRDPVLGHRETIRASRTSSSQPSAFAGSRSRQTRPRSEDVRPAQPPLLLDQSGNRADLS